MKLLIRGAIIILIFYILAVLQTSFFSYFNIYGYVPNFILMFSIIWVILEKPNLNFGIFVAFSGGLMSDIFFSPILGYNILIFSLGAVIVKYILRNYVRIPLTERS
jgi:rod shape-determining protein MreD